MFFVFGISQGKKMLDYAKTVICAQCGGYGRYQVFMTYSYFSLFFIPIINGTAIITYRCHAAALFMSWTRRLENGWDTVNRPI